MQGSEEVKGGAVRWKGQWRSESKHAYTWVAVGIEFLPYLILLPCKGCERRILVIIQASTIGKGQGFITLRHFKIWGSGWKDPGPFCNWRA